MIGQNRVVHRLRTMMKLNPLGWSSDHFTIATAENLYLLMFRLFKSIPSMVGAQRPNIPVRDMQNRQSSSRQNSYRHGRRRCVICNCDYTPLDLNSSGNLQSTSTTVGASASRKSCLFRHKPTQQQEQQGFAFGR